MVSTQQNYYKNRTQSHGNNNFGRPNYQQSGTRNNYQSNNRGGNNYRRNSSNSQSNTPHNIIQVGTLAHSCEGDLVCHSIVDKIPYFNAPIFQENKSKIGKVEEILGLTKDVYFSIRLDEGIIASSFDKDTKVYIDTDKLLPYSRFTQTSRNYSGTKSKLRNRQGLVPKIKRQKNDTKYFNNNNRGKNMSTSYNKKRST